MRESPRAHTVTPPSDQTRQSAADEPTPDEPPVSADSVDPPSTGSALGRPNGAAARRSLSAVVLAAGQGTRMRSTHNKQLQELCGQPLIRRALALVEHVGAAHPVVVLGHQAEQVRAVLPPNARSVVQDPLLGTGHAVQVAEELLRGDGAERLLVTYGDTVLLRPETMQRLARQPVDPDAPLALLTARVPRPYGYGRVVRGADGTVDRIVEEVEATDVERAIGEVWPGVLLTWTAWLWPHLRQLRPSAGGEYYLPDLVRLARADGKRVLATLVEDPEEIHGANDRAQLAEAHAILWRRACVDLMRAGVTIQDPATTFIEPEVRIEPDVVVRPGCHLRGATYIATGCDIGPDAEIVDSSIGESSRVWRSVIESSDVGRGASIGPFSRVRGGATIEDGVHMGNFAEVKGSRLGAHSRMHHFSYLGDADVGARVNLAAGMVTMNYDGRQKHRTVIEDDAFIGCDTLLRAPVTVGAGAATGGGAVVTRDVPPGELWVGAPARRLRSADEPQQPRQSAARDAAHE